MPSLDMHEMARVIESQQDLLQRVMNEQDRLRAEIETLRNRLRTVGINDGERSCLAELMRRRTSNPERISPSAGASFASNKQETDDDFASLPRGGHGIKAGIAAVVDRNIDALVASADRLRTTSRTLHGGGAGICIDTTLPDSLRGPLSPRDSSPRVTWRGNDDWTSPERKPVSALLKSSPCARRQQIASRSASPMQLQHDRLCNGAKLRTSRQQQQLLHRLEDTSESLLGAFIGARREAAMNVVPPAPVEDSISRIGDQYRSASPSMQRSLPFGSSLVLDDLDMVQITEACACGSVFLSDALFCRKCGAKRPAQADDRDAQMLAAYRSSFTAKMLEIGHSAR